ncbi:hypothetical protein Tco_0567092 [Tanacetum coccineum]
MDGTASCDRTSDCVALKFGQIECDGFLANTKGKPHIINIYQSILGFKNTLPERLKDSRHLQQRYQYRFSDERSASSNVRQVGGSIHEEIDVPYRIRHEKCRTKIGQCVACSNPVNSPMKQKSARVSKLHWRHRVQGPKAVNHDAEVTKDTMPPANNGSTKDIQPPVVLIQSRNPNPEPNVVPVVAPVS